MKTKNDTVRVIEPGDTTLRLAAALLLYKSSEGHVYATAHNVQAHPVIKGAPILGPGRPASKEALAEFAAAVTDATAYQGMVPENLLYTGRNTIAWWTPAAKRRVWFKCDDERVGTTSAEIMHTPLVFIVAPAGWFVFALAENQRPTSRTPLYKAPYFNVWKDGAICTGNVDLPDTIGPEVIPSFENAFFRSRFTHSNDQRLVRYAGGAYALWGDQLKNPGQQLLLPGVLLQRKENFEQAINRILKGSDQ